MSNSKHGYATNWEQFVGQDLAKRQIRIAIASASARDTRLDHVLLASGAPGIGKTNLAHLIAGDLGVHMVEVSGKIKPTEARMLLADCTDGDVMFYDEIHTAVAGSRSGADWLLTYLQDGCIPSPMGLEPQPDVTIIAATTDAGKLPETVLSRFIKPKLVPYNESEAALIAHALSARLLLGSLPAAGPDSCRAVARAAVRNPRTMREIWCVVRDIAVATEGENIVGTGMDADYDIASALEMLGLTEDGLTDQGQRYLVTLHDNFSGVAGRTALTDAMREPGGLGHVERVLNELGFISFGKTGRELTRLGTQRARQLGANRRFVAA